jgi:hypothetical protein
MDETHYTAVVQVHRVTKTQETRNGAVRYGDPSGPMPEKRETTEVANVVIRAKTLESLRGKVNDHVSLITED